MAQTIVAPLGNYPDGEFTWGPRNIADSDTRIYFQVLRCTSADTSIWPLSTTTLSMVVEQFSNGEWRAVCGLGGAIGGILPGKAGAGEATITSAGGDFFAGTNRQIRGSFNISGGPLRTSGLLDIT